MEPQPINPEYIQPGDRVRCTWNTWGDVSSVEFVVMDLDRDFLYSNSGRYLHKPPASTDVTWTLIDRPGRPAGSHWRDPETGTKYVRTDESDLGRAHYVAYTKRNHIGSMEKLIPIGPNGRNCVIQRLVPLNGDETATTHTVQDGVWRG